MLTAGSSIVLPFQPNQPVNRKGSFEAWREDWIRTVFADDSLWGSDKNVAAFLALHLNREARACWPSYTTIAKGLGINRSNARRSVRRLIARGYLVREPRGRRQTNLYLPAGGVVTVTPGVVTVTTAVLSQLPPRTSEVEPLKEPLRESVVSVTTGKEEKEGGLPRGKEEKQAKPSVASSPSSSPNEDVPRAAPNGGGGDSTFVKFDTPQWDMVERFGHKAVGKVFMRYGRSEGLWLLKSDLRAIEAAANGGGR
jgi:helix-turn-helix protein